MIISKKLGNTNTIVCVREGGVSSESFVLKMGSSLVQ